MPNTNLLIMPNPLVSIIIPCYNYGHLISHTLDSLTKQTFKDWEALIIDDGSKDETATIIAEYMTKDSRFKYHFQSNSGVSTARNYGIRLSTGSYIQFLDADDLLSPAKIEMQVNLLHEKKDVMVCYCNSVQFGLNANDLTNDVNLENDTLLNMRQI
ncbi:MAG: glycosyltransferase family 2 protein, partial [Pedobacter sp.]